MKNLILVLVTVMSIKAFAVELKEVALWKGYNQMEQSSNLKACQTQLTETRICLTNMFEHKHAAYDVALLEAVNAPTKVVTLYKGYSQAEQSKNQTQCKKAAHFGQLCVTSMWLHKGAAYDVALME